MARKKPNGSKPPKQGKKSDKPMLSIFAGSKEAGTGKSDGVNTFPPTFFREIFEDEGFAIFDFDDWSFVCANDTGMRLLVEALPTLPFITFKFPLKPKDGYTKAKILSWINDRMLDFPMVRLYYVSPGMAVSTFEYLYDAELEFDVDHFLLQAAAFWGINLALVEEFGGDFLDLSFLPDIPI